MTTENNNLFPFVARQTGFYKELSMRNVKWALNQFKSGYMDEETYLAITDFNCKMDDAVSDALRDTMFDAERD